MVNRPSKIRYTDYYMGQRVRSGIIVENGGAVVFSQFHTGEVGVLLYPSQLDFGENKSQCKFIKLYSSPGKITRSAIRYYFYLCILHDFETSFIGDMSIYTRIYLFYLANKANTLYLFLGGIIGFLASILATIFVSC